MNYIYMYIQLKTLEICENPIMDWILLNWNPKIFAFFNFEIYNDIQLQSYK